MILQTEKKACFCANKLYIVRFSVSRYVYPTAVIEVGWVPGKELVTLAKREIRDDRRKGLVCGRRTAIVGESTTIWFCFLLQNRASSAHEITLQMHATPPERKYARPNLRCFIFQETLISACYKWMERH